MDDKTKATLISTTIEVLLFKGIPATIQLLKELNKKDVITVEEIRSLKGDLDSASYFE